jgi:diadenosine tetraphosphate (Ap4A) HIT family hydrolase
MHSTLHKFGFPETVLATFEHWIILLRPQQVTLGSLVLIAKSEVSSFAALPRGAYAELEIVTRCIETSLRKFRNFEKINYIMLMMVDPHVHFHVFPRYNAAQTFSRLGFQDTGWPGPPDLKSGVTLTPDQIGLLVRDLSFFFETMD